MKLTLARRTTIRAAMINLADAIWITLLVILLTVDMRADVPGDIVIIPEITDWSCDGT